MATTNRFEDLEIWQELYRLYDCGYITQEKLEYLKAEYEKLSGRISNFITYLNKKDFKGNKFQ